MNFAATPAKDSTVAQLESLYAERELLERELGISDPDEIHKLLTSLEAQLKSFYSERDANAGGGFNAASDVGGLQAAIRHIEAQLERILQQLPGAGGGAGGSFGSADSSIEHQLCDIYAGRAQLQQNWGISDAQDIISMVRNLEAQLRDLYAEREAASNPSFSGAPTARPSFCASSFGGGNFGGGFSGSVGSGNSAGAQQRIDNMQQQLCSIYAEREQLERNFGTADANQLIAMANSLEAQLRDFYADRDAGNASFGGGFNGGHAGGQDLQKQSENLEAQLCDLYAERSLLEQRLGVSDGQDVIKMISNMQTQLHDLYNQREQSLHAAPSFMN